MTLFHAYLISGGNAEERLDYAVNFASEVFGLDDPEAAFKIERGVHEDLHFVLPDPEKKTPVLSVAVIEQLQAVMKSKPLASPMKIAIIPEAEKMNESAQNKLLKLLEEPASGDILLLLTQNEEKLLPTVRSRCVRKRLTGGERIDADAALLDTVKDIVRILVYDRGVLAEAFAILDEFTGSADESINLLFSLEAFLRDMAVGTYDSNLLWDETLAANTEKMTPKMAYRLMKCIDHIEVAISDIEGGLRPKTCLRDMALQIKAGGVNA
ncbi:MAG: hypothetical protein LBN34_01085 [Clostridiales Family XIII bacterium]|jgi:hypothetical protein|nr:hypothetical protein [Clostridiales Family XIII bacterium]